MLADRSQIAQTLFCILIWVCVFVAICKLIHSSTDVPYCNDNLMTFCICKMRTFWGENGVFRETLRGELREPGWLGSHTTSTPPDDYQPMYDLVYEFFFFSKPKKALFGWLLWTTNWQIERRWSNARLSLSIRVVLALTAKMFTVCLFTEHLQNGHTNKLMGSPNWKIIKCDSVKSATQCRHLVTSNWLQIDTASAAANNADLFKVTHFVVVVVVIVMTCWCHYC